MAPRVLLLCLSIVKSVPVVFISAVIVWSYYAYVFQMCFFSVPSLLEKVVYLIVYHPLLIMMAWSYWKTIFTPILTTPKQFYLPTPLVDQLQEATDQCTRRALLQQFGKTLPAHCRTLTGEMRYCDRCKAIKPDRAHHCSVCGRCVLKMDHHCPWVNNCVGFSNYKFFVLFLGYAMTYCIFVSMSSLQYFILFWKGISSDKPDMHNLHIVFLFFAGVMFTISLLSLFGYHCYLLTRNKTTLESFQVPVFTTGPERDGFNLGCYRNFIYLFGSDRKLWFLPIHTGFGNGLTFPGRNIDESNDALLGRRQRWAEEGLCDDDDSV